jgi:hypothetical protein
LLAFMVGLAGMGVCQLARTGNSAQEVKSAEAHPQSLTKLQVAEGVR